MSKTMPDLSHFRGSCSFERWSMLFGDIMTEGVKCLVNAVGAYWFLDIIGSYQHKLKQADFQVWTIKVTGSKAVVTMREDTGQPALITQRIDYTDFPEGEFKLWACRNERGSVTVMLPSEY